MHKVATDIEQKITIPLIHIADATGCVLQQDRVKKVGLLGTRFTMEQTFYTLLLQMPNNETRFITLFMNNYARA